MELKNSNQEAPQVEQPSSLHKITPLSKYLAMTLFVILPFLGGYVGYVYAPEKVIEVEKIVVVEKETNGEVDFKEVIEVENKTYVNNEYGFNFEYPREYSLPSNINRIPGNDPFFEEYLDDDKSRITYSSGDGPIFTLYGANHDLGKEGYGRPVCTNSTFESLDDCVKKTNQVGTEYFEREVRRNYGWEKGYEFKVNDDLSLIIVQQGGDNRDYLELNEFQGMLIDTFGLVGS